MSRDFGGPSLKEIGIKEEEINQEASNQEPGKEKRANGEEKRRVYFKDHPGVRFKEEFLKADEYARDIEENRLNLKEAEDDSWKVRREAVSRKAHMEMGNESDERDREILENKIHSGKAAFRKRL